jgi:hypothetical protein
MFGDIRGLAKLLGADDLPEDKGTDEDFPKVLVPEHLI